MNTYRDDLAFAVLAFRHLRQLLVEESTRAKMGVNGETASAEVEPSKSEKFIGEKKNEIRQRYFEKVKSLPKLGCRNAFLQTSKLLCDGEQLFRLVVAELALRNETANDESSLKEIFLETAKEFNFGTHLFNLGSDFGVWAHFKSNA